MSYLYNGKMKVIGVTGPSGSGKSTVSEILSKNENVEIIDADEVVRQLSKPGNDYLKAIKNTFGQEVFLDDGNLNRKVLADKIYNDENSKKRLNDLTFKYVVDEILLRLKENSDKNINISVIDVPLLFEAGLDKYCDFIISVIADEELKIKRICKRDNVDIQTAKSRLNIQHENNFYIEKSDFVINNSENFDLENEVKNIFEKITLKINLK